MKVLPTVYFNGAIASTAPKAKASGCNENKQKRRELVEAHLNKYIITFGNNYRVNNPCGFVYILKEIFDLPQDKACNYETYKPTVKNIEMAFHRQDPMLTSIKILSECQRQRLIDIIVESGLNIRENVLGRTSVNSEMAQEAIKVHNAFQDTGGKSFGEALLELKDLTGEIAALASVSGLAEWDLNTYMPKEASEDRGWQQGQISKICHKILTSEKLGSLLQKLEEDSILSKLDKTDQALVRELSRSRKKAIKLPESLVIELSEVTSVAQTVWKDSKDKNDFKSFVQYLEKVFSLMRQEAEYLGYEGSPYNALLDDFEIGMTTEKLDKVFARLKQELVPIIKTIRETNIRPNNSFLKLKYDKAKQLDIGKAILRHIGFDFSIGRLDEVEHPFMSGFNPHDGRITTHVHEDNVMSNITSCIHEGGHWLYQLGIDKNLYKTPLWDGASFGIHESQSRMYETMVGQGLPFWRYFFPVLKHTFPEQLGSVTSDEFYKAINIVEPNFIRIESDELTYQMHIILRYEIERDLIEGKIQVKDLPQIWNKKMEEYLGIIPDTDSKGVLQDVHWSAGLVGYFPTYTLGNLYAAQFYNTAKKEIPDLEERIASGDVTTLRNWLREKIHKYGKTETPTEILKRVTGEDLNPDYFISYIKFKYLSEKLYKVK